VVELLVVMAIISILTVSVVPWMISYWRAAALKAGAEEVAAGLNRGRQLAISQSRSVCVEVTANRYRYLLNGCAGTPWLGPGSSATGFFGLANSVGLTANANPVFDYLGTASPGATLTVTHAQISTNLSVVVSVAGRVRICPAGGCSP
jgi:Tfp pilus assembly protein FimT